MARATLCTGRAALIMTDCAIQSVRMFTQTGMPGMLSILLCRWLPDCTPKCSEQPLRKADRPLGAALKYLVCIVHMQTSCRAPGSGKTVTNSIGLRTGMKASSGNVSLKPWPRIDREVLQVPGASHNNLVGKLYYKNCFPLLCNPAALIA